MTNELQDELLALLDKWDALAELGRHKRVGDDAAYFGGVMDSFQMAHRDLRRVVTVALAEPVEPFEDSYEIEARQPEALLLN